MDDIIKALNVIADHEKQDKNNRTPIVIAAMFDLSCIAEKLIESGADVNEPGPENKTALFLAAARGHDYMCRILLDAGADKNIKYKNLTPLHAAKEMNHPNVIKLLSDQTTE